MSREIFAMHNDGQKRKCLFYAICTYIITEINYAFIHFFSPLFFLFVSGSSTQIRHLSLKALLPNTDQYMTYEGSTTHPGCWESTVWIILNKPIYITKQEVISS
jgi:carbonic anhydrase